MRTVGQVTTCARCVEFACDLEALEQRSPSAANGAGEYSAPGAIGHSVWPSVVGTCVLATRLVARCLLRRRAIAGTLGGVAVQTRTIGAEASRP